MREILTKKIRVYGIVQGVGFRPTVSRHALALDVKGTVCNKGPYVEIIAQSDEKILYEFENLIKNKAPKRAIILKIDSEKIHTEEQVYEEFTIIESEKEKGDILIPPDIATCDECKAELYDKSNRRYLHPFINCTCCGPRMTILENLPYDRIRTSMKIFPMCSECETEYNEPSSRRYDAQPVCCNHCGPKLYILDADEDDTNDPITVARRTILEGGIVAVKGIGGFHLCCDAKNEKAVSLLRTRKKRPTKPFAVMMKNLETVRRECEVVEAAQEILTGHQKPIVLLQKRDASSVADSVAPGNPKLGVMLPYAPVQMLLFDYDDDVEMTDCLVMTSGNSSGVPICKDEESAREELGFLSDKILSNNRPIRLRADDSVMDLFLEKPYMIRRSRGYAPLPFVVDTNSTRNVLAVGGELKNSFCVAKGDMFYISPYIGDMEQLKTMDAFRDSSRVFLDMLEVEPETIVCDMHPLYNTSLMAEEFGKPVIKVQHHFAHIVSCMAENNYLGKVIGVALDGTGYGTDGSIWGGEILEADCCDFTRLESIKPFKQIGGDASSRDGYRIAVSMIYGIYREEEMPREKTIETVEQLKLCESDDAKVIMACYDKNINSVVSTSAGRLFDAVSAVLGIKYSSTFEGEASQNLMYEAQRFDASKLAGVEVENDSDNWNLNNTDLLFERILEARLSGVEISELAYYFHERLSHMICNSCVKAREKNGLRPVALSGGCFQNVLLLELTKRYLEREGFTVLIHSLVPPNDGGLALGQAVIGLMKGE